MSRPEGVSSGIQVRYRHETIGRLLTALQSYLKK